MGCAGSKQRVCKKCRTPYSHMSRSYSEHIHHPPENEGDSYHKVTLNFSTMGSLKLDSIYQNHPPIEQDDDHHDDEIGPESKRIELFTLGLIEAMTWSNLMDEKIPKIVPKTPITTPPGEPEMIDAQELMAGLEDSSHPRRSFTFHVCPKSNCQEIGSEISRKSMEDLPPTNPFHLKQNPFHDSPNSDIPKSKFQEIGSEITDPFHLKKVVLYFTTLRGVRKTYEDCCHVRMVLKGLGVRVDERDVSMHSGFREEIKELLGDGFTGIMKLPMVFIGRNCIGGAEEIRRMHEEGELEMAVADCEVDDGDGGACGACGDIRFVPCETCSGSCKVYYEQEEEEDDEEEDEEEGEETEFGFKRCPDCNENGVIRCPICCD